VNPPSSYDEGYRSSDLTPEGDGICVLYKEIVSNSRGLREVEIHNGSVLRVTCSIEPFASLQELWAITVKVEHESLELKCEVVRGYFIWHNFE
jgi:hypothetical protein